MPSERGASLLQPPSTTPDVEQNIGVNLGLTCNLGLSLDLDHILVCMVPVRCGFGRNCALSVYRVWIYCEGLQIAIFVQCVVGQRLLEEL